MDQSISASPSGTNGPQETPSNDNDGQWKEKVDNNEVYTTVRPGMMRRATSHALYDSLYVTLSQLRSRERALAEHFQHLIEDQTTGPGVVVDFEGEDDPYKPINWNPRRKYVTTLLYSLATFSITFSSSIYQSGAEEISKAFGVGPIVSSLGTSLMLFSFGLGPLLWAPVSELYGRKAAVLTPYAVAAIFTFATGAAKDIQTVLITRFFAGLFGSAPIINSGGVMGDLYSPKQRGVALVFYATVLLGGPTLGPVIGGALVQSYDDGWRWTQYLTGMIMSVILVFCILCVNESYGPVLLTHKARRLRLEKGNYALHAKHEEWDASVSEFAKKYLVRPIQLLSTPIALLIDIYCAFIYGFFYSTFGSFPIAFQEVRGWNQLVGALPFLALLLGILIGGLANTLNQKYYFRQLKENGGKAVPEARLPPMMLGSVIFAAGLFVFAWTSSPSTHWIGSQIGCVLTGFGFFTIFQPSLNYLIDTFGPQYGASAIAAQTFLRSTLAGAFSIFVPIMCRSVLGVEWSITIFACLGTILIPVPYLFFFFGKRIRAGNAWSRDT